MLVPSCIIFKEQTANSVDPNKVAGYEPPFLGLHLFVNLTTLYFHYGALTHCILVDFSIVVCWTSPFVVFGWRVYFVTFILFLMENALSRHCRP